MRKMIFFALLLIMVVPAFSQQTNTSTVLTKEDYLKKSSNQKTTGVVMIVGGAGCALFGTLIVTAIAKTLTAGAVTMGIGLISIPAGIPFLIAASRNKKKGMSLSLKNETAPHLQNRSFVTHSVPSLSLKISL